MEAVHKVHQNTMRDPTFAGQKWFKYLENKTNAS